MSEAVKLNAEIREKTGKGSARALRKSGLVPATLYGTEKSPLSLSVEEKEMTKLYRRKGFTSTVMELNMEGKKHNVLAKDVQLHPITDLVQHVDFVYLGKKDQKVMIPLNVEGRDKSVGIKRGGFFNLIHRSVALNCPANDIPSALEIDISKMIVGSSIRGTDLNLPKGCSLAIKEDSIIASMIGRGGAKETEDESKAEETATSEKAE